MSLLFGSRYRDEEDDSFSGLIASKMRNSLEEDCVPVRKKQQRLHPREVVHNPLPLQELDD